MPPLGRLSLRQRYANVRVQAPDLSPTFALRLRVTVLLEHLHIRQPPIAVDRQPRGQRVIGCAICKAVGLLQHRASQRRVDVAQIRRPHGVLLQQPIADSVDAEGVVRVAGGQIECASFHFHLKLENTQRMRVSASVV